MPLKNIEEEMCWEIEKKRQGQGLGWEREDNLDGCFVMEERLFRFAVENRECKGVSIIFEPLFVT